MNHIDRLADFQDETRLSVSQVRLPASPSPFVWSDTVPPREWLYGRHYIRKFISATVAPGGVGKSSLAMVELLAMITGRNLLGVTPHEPVRGWYWNGEDPKDELQRRVVAAARHYQVKQEDLEGRLFVDSGRDNKIVVATKIGNNVTVCVPVVDALVSHIRDRKIDVLVVDPFVACHRVTENDNNAIEDVASAWADIADQTGCAVELVHHSRKTNGEVTVEDARGASALLAKARSARVLNVMTDGEATKAEIESHERRRYFRVEAGKANMAASSSAVTWYKMESFDLENRTASRPSDMVGVATSWAWPVPEVAEVSLQDLLAIQTKIAGGMNRASSQANAWAGKAVAEVLGMNARDAKDKAEIKRLIAKWISAGSLGEKTVVNKEKCRAEPYIVVEKWVKSASVSTP